MKTHTQPYKTVNLQQGSIAWLAWRHQGIGASEAPTVMGENPWQSPVDLLRAKRGPAPEPDTHDRISAAMQFGTDMEPVARRAYERATGHKVTPACLQSSRYTWLRASLDGISADGRRAVEIKCGKGVYHHTARTRTVPRYYYGQLQHIMAVTRLESVDFWAWLPDQTPIGLTVPRDPDYIGAMLDREHDFWQQVRLSTH